MLGWPKDVPLDIGKPESTHLLRRCDLALRQEKLRLTVGEATVLARFRC